MADHDLFHIGWSVASSRNEAAPPLDDASRKLLTGIGAASIASDAATAAIVANEKALKETRAEIKALQRIVPVQSFNDLAKAAGAETQRRRAGL